MPSNPLSTPLEIRLFEAGDAEYLSALFRSSVSKAAADDYSPEQVAAWGLAAPEPAFYLRQAERSTVLVAVGSAGDLVGYGTLEPNGHIDHLYCREDVLATGIGSALYSSLEATAKAAGIKVLFVEASEAARRLLERRGFITDTRNDFLLHGVPIHNYRMSKTIA